MTFSNKALLSFRLFCWKLPTKVGQHRRRGSQEDGGDCDDDLQASRRKGEEVLEGALQVRGRRWALDHPPNDIGSPIGQGNDTS